jgi:hypothetical protein
VVRVAEEIQREIAELDRLDAYLQGKQRRGLRVESTAGGPESS